MKQIILILLISFPFINSYAESSYDPYSGNFYSVTPDPNGGAQIYGNNFNTGSQWRTTVDSNGDMRGTDANGNYWSYNNSSGTYNNFGTGEICVGKGVGRVCN